jgi:hypothetical protein
MKTLVAKKAKALPWAHEIAKIGKAAIKAAVQEHFKAGRSITVMKEGRLIRLGPK